VTVTDAAGSAPTRGPIDLWMALLAGPVAGALQLSVGYALVKWACAAGGEWLLGVLAGVFLATALGGAAWAATHLRTTGEPDRSRQEWSAGSRQLVAMMAIGVNLLTAIFMANAIIAIAALSPCE